MRKWGLTPFMSRDKINFRLGNKKSEREQM